MVTPVSSKTVGQRLATEVLGSFEAFEYAIREAIGNSNYVLIRDLARQLDAVETRDELVKCPFCEGTFNLPAVKASVLPETEASHASFEEWYCEIYARRPDAFQGSKAALRSAWEAGATSVCRSAAADGEGAGAKAESHPTGGATGAQLPIATSSEKTSCKPECPTCRTELAFEGDVCGLCLPVAQP